jgi:hypothetical protein
MHPLPGSKKILRGSSLITTNFAKGPPAQQIFKKAIPRPKILKKEKAL